MIYIVHVCRRRVPGIPPQHASYDPCTLTENKLTYCQLGGHVVASEKRIGIRRPHLHTLHTL